MADELDIPMPSMMPAGASNWRNARRRDPLDSTTRRLALFAGAIGGGLLLLVGGWSLTGRHASGIPVVDADPRPLRTKPANPGGMQIAGQDDAILSGSEGGQDAMAPPPETPAPDALREAAQQAEAAAAAPPPAPTQPASLVTPEPAPPAAAIAAIPEEPASPAKPAAAQVAPRVATGAGPQVQLAALPSEDAAKAEWQRLVHKMPELLGGRAPVVTRIERTDGKVFWRLRTSGFPDIAQATAFCEKVRAKGGGCMLASL
jgi:hypothetical protein